MRLRSVAMVLLLAAPGCAWLKDRLRPPKTPEPGWAMVEVDRVAFDGEQLSFRLLVGARDGGVVLDRRLIPNTNLDLRDVWACDGGAMPVPHFIFDFFPDAPGPSDRLTIHEGDWFGVEEQYPLFLAEEDGGNVPSCVDAEFLLHLESAANTPHFHVVGARPTPESDAGQP